MVSGPCVFTSHDVKIFIIILCIVVSLTYSYIILSVPFINIHLQLSLLIKNWLIKIVLSIIDVLESSNHIISLNFVINIFFI